MEQVDERQRKDGAESEPVPLLSVRNLSAAYGKRPVLTGLDLDVHRGERVALLGHNGAGKTTALRCISGALPALTGTLTLDGKEFTGQTQARIARAGISTVPQGSGVFPALTVDENLRVAKGIADSADSAEEVAAVIRDLFPILSKRGKQRAGSLSGGQRQMVAIGMALMADPRLLLLDEPSTGLAPVLVTEVLAAIEEINTRLGITMLIVEQNLNETLKHAQRVYVLQLGRIVFDGSVDEFYDMEFAQLF